MNRGVSKYPALVGLSGAEYVRAWERMKRDELDALGLTTRQTVRVRGKMVRNPDLIGLPPNLYNAIRARRLRARKNVALSALLDRIVAFVAEAYSSLPEPLRADAKLFGETTGSGAAEQSETKGEYRMSKSWLEELKTPVVEINAVAKPQAPTGRHMAFEIRVVMPPGATWKQDPTQVAFTLGNVCNHWIGQAISSRFGFSIETKAVDYMRGQREKAIAFDLLIAGEKVNRKNAERALRIARGLR